MVDERSRCPFCRKGFFVAEKGITSGDTAFFCNNCFKYKEEEVEVIGHRGGGQHYNSEDFWNDCWT